MHAFNCEKVTPSELKNSIQELTHQATYKPSPDEVTKKVNLHFNLKQVLLSDIYFSIYSQKIEQYIYAGLFTPTLSIEANDNLLKDKGGDVLIFQFFRKDTGEICTWENDGGDIVWISNANVHVNFLATRELDENNLPIAFKVSIEK
jgi:hypothetical protein